MAPDIDIDAPIWAPVTFALNAGLVLRWLVSIVARDRRFHNMALGCRELILTTRQATESLALKRVRSFQDAVCFDTRRYRGAQ